MYLVCQQLSGSRLGPTGNSLFTVEYVDTPSQSYINDTQTHITMYKANCLIVEEGDQESELCFFERGSRASIYASKSRRQLHLICDGFC